MFLRVDDCLITVNMILIISAFLLTISDDGTFVPLHKICIGQRANFTNIMRAHNFGCVKVLLLNKTLYNFLLFVQYTLTRISEELICSLNTPILSM